MRFRRVRVLYHQNQSPMQTDRELLRRYAAEHDEAAFAEIVRRHANLAYTTALRVLNGDAHLAQDAAQATFAGLAAQAGEMGDLSTLAGWLHTCARHHAMKAVRTERRRRFREQEAFAMSDQTTPPEPTWEQLGPMLDEAVNQLAPADRDAVLLRYFENKSHREVGDALGLNENTARMRVERALDKLRGYFMQHGLPVSSASLAVALEAQAVTTPLTLAQMGALSSAVLGGASAGATTAFTLHSLLAMTSTKIVLAAATVVIAAGITTTLAIRKTDAPLAPAPTAVAQATPTASTPTAQSAIAAKVEAPKVAAVPASGSGTVSMPADPAITPPSGTLSFNGTQSFNNTRLQKWNANFTSLQSSTPASPAQADSLATQLETKKRNLEAFKKSSQGVLDQALARANGDAAELTKADTARKQYDAYIQQQQKEIDAMEQKLVQSQSGTQP